MKNDEYGSTLEWSAVPPVSLACSNKINLFDVRQIQLPLLTFISGVT